MEKRNLQKGRWCKVLGGGGRNGQNGQNGQNGHGTRIRVSHVLWKLRSTWHALHPVPIVRQVRPVRQVRYSLLPPCALRNVLCQLTEHTAMCFGNSGAHGTHCTKCQSSVQVRTSPYKSVFPCPHPVHCAMYSASHPLSVFFLKKISLGLQFFLICAIIS